MFAEQMRLRELYATPPTVRLTKHDWKDEPMKSVKDLLMAFYDPLFYAKEGFPNPDDSDFHKDGFIQGFQPTVKICPYTDNCIQDTKLDHFLPKDHFPALSCHPDNLIPCSTDPNSIEHKGRRAPLDFNEQEQTAKWFHPRWRMASGKFRLSFGNTATRQPDVQFHALAAEDQPRLENTAAMFGLKVFWAKHLGDDVQHVASLVSDDFCEDGIEPTEQLVKQRVERLAAQKVKYEVGRQALAIVHSHFYAHVAATPVLLNQVLQTCVRDFAMRNAAPAAAE
jgi:hypothetical protein